MTEFTIKLAEASIFVRCFFSSTKDFCRDYLTDEKGEFEAEISAEDIFRERCLGARQMYLEGHRQEDYSDAYMETLALYRKIAEMLVEHGVMLLHGCVIAYGGKAYVFAARSGTGKTTHCNLWLKNIPGCHVLNGDKPLLLFKDDKVLACGTPWQGKEQLGTNEILPVEAICLLTRAETNKIEPVSFSEAFQDIIAQCYKPHGSRLAASMKLVSRLSGVKLYRLGCNMDREAALVSFSGMTGEKVPD